MKIKNATTRYYNALIHIHQLMNRKPTELQMMEIFKLHRVGATALKVLIKFGIIEKTGKNTYYWKDEEPTVSMAEDLVHETRVQLALDKEIAAAKNIEVNEPEVVIAEPKPKDLFDLEKIINEKFFGRIIEPKPKPVKHWEVKIGFIKFKIQPVF